LLLSSDKQLQKTFDFIYVLQPKDDVRRLYKIFELNSIYFLYDGPKKEIKSLYLDPSEIFTTYKSLADTFAFYKNFKFDVEPYSSGKIEKIEDNFSLNKLCMSDHECAVLFFPATYEENKIEEFNTLIGKLNNIKQKNTFENLKISWVNSTCHGDMLDRINYDQQKQKTPVLIFFWPWRAAYSSFDYMFEEFPMEEFLKKGLEQRVKFTRIEREQISIKNRNCEDPDALLEDDDIINAIGVEENKENINIENNNSEKVEKTEEVNLDDNGKKKDL